MTHLQVRLKLELGLLELEQRLLDADRREQHKVAAARGPRGVEAVLGGLHATAEYCSVIDTFNRALETSHRRATQRVATGGRAPGSRCPTSP